MPKLMLLTTDRSYRNNAFFQAAQRLDIDVLPVVDMTLALAAQLAAAHRRRLRPPDATRRRRWRGHSRAHRCPCCAGRGRRSGRLVAAKNRAAPGPASQ
ncbi:MAG: hypothetical protein R3A10_09670 [Caldilineaceae bacterium]